jgi:DNA-binding transcriptional LysR family regulator
MRAAVLAGVGLAQVPDWLFTHELASGAVRAVLRDYEPAQLPTYIVRPAAQRLPTKLRVFIDFVAQIFTKETRE